MADTQDGDYYLHWGISETDADTEEEDEYDLDHDSIVSNILEADDVGRFVSMINVKVHYCLHGLMIDYTLKSDREILLCDLWTSSAVKCAAALLNGDTFIQVDVNRPDSDGLYPLHYAAGSGFASMIELLLSHGARTDVWCEDPDSPLYRKLPLHLLFTLLGEGYYLKKYADEKSVLMMVANLCRMKTACHRFLENLRVLALRGKEAEEEFLSSIRHGDLIKLAGLLMVAHKKLIPGLMKADREAADKPVRQLLLVFEKAGDVIDAYSCEHEDNNPQVSEDQAEADVARLLQEAAGLIEDLDTQPSLEGSLPRWAPKEYNQQRLPKEHREGRYYRQPSFSLRTTTPVQLNFSVSPAMNLQTIQSRSIFPFSRDYYSLGGTTKIDTKKEDKDELIYERMVSKILIADDDRRLVSMINEKVLHCPTGRTIDFNTEFFQEGLLCNLWMSSAVKCATALMNGDTFIEVDVNRPDSMSLYPLHYAAQYGFASMIELLLSRGGRTDVRCEKGLAFLHMRFPLHLAFEALCKDTYMRMWASQNSALGLVLRLCRPGTEFHLLENLRVLAWRGKEAEDLFLHCIRVGDLMKLAGLLMVAHKKLIPGLMKTDREAADKPVRQLLLVFEKAGDAIDVYRCKHEDERISEEQTYKDVAKLLREAGFVVDFPEGSYPRCVPAYHRQGLPKEHRGFKASYLVSHRKGPFYIWPAFSQWATTLPVEPKYKPSPSEKLRDYNSLLPFSRFDPQLSNEAMKKVMGAERQLQMKRWISSSALRFIKRI